MSANAEATTLEERPRVRPRVRSQVASQSEQRRIQTPSRLEVSTVRGGKRSWTASDTTCKRDWKLIQKKVC